ncbi:phosphodiester glycosidase family protein [Litoribacter ruber]|uniref:phosphodiester glycosidase family protein n=1 Tax=Litoribacter ruber TaxID=702568 RepID=UPI001BD981B0|nr:phosphodiester glycosidase family protein [Litoribacter ruber]MBT0810498.1 phosphodiester glycosidase family protein [Litoribacter ruber]
MSRQKPLQFNSPITIHAMTTKIRLFIVLFFLSWQLPAQEIQLDWIERADLNILLPNSIRVYESHGQLADGSPVKATYTKVDLMDDNLNFKAVGSNIARQTTLDAALQNDALVAINGGYFSSNESVSLLISDGELIASGPAQGTARGAMGFIAGQPEITWPHINPDNQEIYSFLSPTVGEGDFDAAKKWKATQAIGGGPVLIKDGQIENYGKAEGFGGSHLARHPRTAVGYTADDQLILMIVDGRQESSAGVTLDELAELMKGIGSYEALNWDGGGSSAMIVADEVANIPSDIPGGNRNSLRKNASALVIQEKKKSNKPKTIILDTEHEQYAEKGIWKDSNHSSYYGHSPSRIANAESTYNSAAYNIEGLEGKKYQLASWWTVNTKTNSSKNLAIIHHLEGIDSVFIHQNDIKTSGKWNVLGEYKFGQDSKVEFFPQGEGKLVTDALRLVEMKDSQKIQKRGDLRLAVISDLNSGLGAADYEWQVDSIIQRIPRLWQPDMVVCGGDMVAGMGISDPEHLNKMWAGFDKHIAAPLRQANIPFAFTLGNHDGPRSYPIEHQAAKEFWKDPEMETGLEFVDQSNFPNWYSFKKGNAFFISWEASSPVINQENLEWLEEQLSSEEAQQAQYRFVMGHMPLYGVAQERDSKGNVLENPKKLRSILEEYGVHTYISGHQHAYYPGRRGDLELLNAGAAGSGPRGWLDMDFPPQHTVTIMDIFYEQDTIIYTTFDIKEKNAADMKVFDDKKLPPAVFGVNGHLIRRDILLAETFSTGKDQAITLQVKGNAFVTSGRNFNRKDKTLKFYKGRNTEEGELLKSFEISPDKSGQFETSIDYDRDWHEWLAAGAIYAQVDNYPPRHLLSSEFATPSAPTITSHNPRNVYGVRNIEALYTVEWSPAESAMGNWIGYTYQVSDSESFAKVLFEKETNRVTEVKMRESDWYAMLENKPSGQPKTLFHRVISSDGKNDVHSSPSPIHLMKSEEPLEDFIEVPAPDYQFVGKVEGASGAGYGALWDDEGKLWLADYGGKLTVIDPDGTESTLSPIKKVELDGEELSLNPINGIGLDNDGHILIGRNRLLLKIDSKTGEGLAKWEVPEGNRAITSPRAAKNGEVYVMSLFAEDGNFVLKQNGKAFEMVRELILPDRILARTFEMEKEGKRLFFPNPGSPYIQTYESEDGQNFKSAEDITSIAAGSNAIHVSSEGKIYLAVRASGVKPATFHFRDEKNKRMWTLDLPEVQGAEARGIGVSPDGKTLIFCSYDKGGGYYIYKLKEDQ